MQYCSLKYAEALFYTDGLQSWMPLSQRKFAHFELEASRNTPIVGEPSVVKSRLVWEATHSHRVHGWQVLQAGSASYGKAASYLPVIDLLNSYFEIEDPDGPRAIREKVTGKLLTLDWALEDSLPALFSLLEVPIDDLRWQVLDPPQRRRMTLDAVKRLLIRESQVQPLQVVFEDPHCIPHQFLDLLDNNVSKTVSCRSKGNHSTNHELQAPPKNQRIPTNGPH